MFPQTILITLLTTTATATITCLKLGQPATATWTNALGKSCSWQGTVGSNFGVNPVNKGNYSCNGRCGAACDEGPFGGRLGNAYTQDCWSHDICSWFNGATGGSKDPNCGKAFESAQDDYVLGISSGCGLSNPTFAAQAPLGAPTCV